MGDVALRSRLVAGIEVEHAFWCFGRRKNEGRSEVVRKRIGLDLGLDL